MMLFLKPNEDITSWNFKSHSQLVYSNLF